MSYHKMETSSSKNFVLKIETTVSVFFCFASMFMTKIVFGTIKAVEALLEKLGLFHLINIRKRSMLVFGIVCIFSALFITLNVDFPYSNIRFISLLLIFLVGLSLIIRFGETALETPDSIEKIEKQVFKSKIESWFAKRMKNAIDAVWIHPLIILSIMIIPVFFAILIPSSFSMFTVLAYGTVFSIGFDAINAFEHTNSHNHFFRNYHLSKKEKWYFKFIQIYCDYILNFMYARIPHWYRVQHVIIHHVEDNGENDTQSTLPYDRSSFIDFSRCAFRFAISGLFSVDIYKYLIQRNRKKAIMDLTKGMIFFYATLLLISLWHWQFAVTIFSFRFIGQIISTLGFLHEHGMIDISEPKNIYKNSLHFLTSENAHASLGDDAHIEHHLHQGRHWSEYIEDFKINSEEYKRENALGFKDGPGGLSQYFFLIWRGNFNALANLFVVFGKPEASNDEIANILKERTRPITSKQRGKLENALDKLLGWSAGFLLPSWQENKP